MSAITAKASRKMKKYAVLTREPRCFLGSFDFSWEQRKFSELVQIERGGSPRPIDDFITDAPNGLNWVKIGDAPTQGNYITKTAEKIRPEGLSKTREVHPGDLILSNSMSFGKPYIMDIDGCIHDGWLLIRNTYGVFDLTFLCHLLGTPQMLSQYRSLAAGSTVNNLNKELVGNTVVTIPSITEQRVLGDYLEQLDNLITLHQRKCANLCSPSQVVFSLLFVTSTFSWEQRKLGDISEIKTGPFGSTLHADDYVSDGTPIITTEHFKTGALPRSKNGLPQVSDSDYKRLTAYTLDDGDIVFSRVGSVDINALITPFQSNWLFSGRVLRVRPQTDISSKFLHTRLETESIKTDIRTRAVGQTMPSINTEILKITPLVLPSSAAEQEQIGSYFAALDNLITLHQRECISFTGRADRLILTANKKRTTSSWEQRKLSELTSMHARIGWQNLRTSEFLDSGNYMLITGTDFNDGAINFSTCHYVERERYEQDRNIQIHNGSILITKDGTLGKVAYVQGLSMPATLNAGVFNVQIKDANNVDEKYLFQYLKAPFLMDYVDKKATGGTIKHLNQSILVDFPVILPQRSEQTLIGAFFQQLDNLITLHQRKPFLMKWRNSDANRNQTNRLVL